MNNAPLSASFYKVGGALPQDVPSYVTRASDRELYDALQAREFCYVLNSRQMGKSSLMVRTLTRLQAEGWAGVILDFSAKDSQSDQPDRWYDGIINQLNRQLGLLDRQFFRAWLKERDFIASVERLEEFIDTVLLPGINSPIVILIDEIDSTINLPFTDDFFALIRVCYNKRAEKPEYERLTLALFGVAMPSELIGDAKRTPFNIGKSIDLKGFDFEETLPLAAGLTGKADLPQVVLQEILHWTGGQPFLTQRLCQLVVDASFSIAEGNEATLIEGLVRSRLIEHWESQDHQEHLKTIRKRILDNEQKAGYLLELYRQIRQAGSLPAQNRPEERELQLTGIVVKRDGTLQVYNPIYSAVFDEAWIDAELKQLRPYAESFRAWIASGKTDNSRLLRGGALEEAEQWAAEKSPSAEDREFLSASRTQQREEQIAAKERDAELVREKAAREAAEAAKRIEEDANRQAQRKIRRGSLVLGTALVAAGLLGGLALVSGNQLRIANQQLAEAQTLAQEAKDEALEAKDELTRIQAQKEQVDQELSQARDDIETKRNELTAATENLARSQETLKSLEAQRQVADERLKQAQQAAQGQQELLNQLEQDLADADAAVTQAVEAEQAAQQRANQAQAELDQAQANLIAINNHIDIVNKLSDLVGELYGNNKSEEERKPEAARDAIEQIGLSFTDFTGDNTDLKQALLNSGIALAHLHLDPQDKNNRAAEAISKSIQLIEVKPQLFNSSHNSKAIAFFTYAVQGNLLEEQASDRSSRVAYERAFSYVDSNFNSNWDSVAYSYHKLLDSWIRSANWKDWDSLRTLGRASLKKHYGFQAKQLIRELELVITRYQWREADGLTSRAITAFAYSKNLDFSYSNISCSSLRTIDALWFDHSEGRFGFRVQKKIYLDTGNSLDSFNGATWEKFLYTVGWIRINGEAQELNPLNYNERIDYLDYDELSWERESYMKDTLIGHLPVGRAAVGLGGLSGSWGGPAMEEISSLMQRIEACNI